MRSAFVCSAAAVWLLAAAPAMADEPRPTHVSIGGGSFLGITGPDWGGVGAAEIYPGGRFGRFGLRGELRGYEGIDAGQATLGVVYEGASARPRLQLALHADAGITWGEVHPVIGGGIETHLWLWGPLALVLDGGATLIYDGVDSVLAINGSSQLRLAW